MHTCPVLYIALPYSIASQILLHIVIPYCILHCFILYSVRGGAELRWALSYPLLHIVVKLVIESALVPDTFLQGINLPLKDFYFIIQQ